MTTPRTLREIVAEFLHNPPGSVQVSVIHLRRATEREAILADLEAAVGEPLHTFEAVDGRDAFQERGCGRMCGLEPGKERTNGELGCFLSHVGLAREALAAGKQALVIFEDDCQVIDKDRFLQHTQSYLQAVEALEAEIPHPMGEFLLFGSGGTYSSWSISSRVKLTNHFNCTHAVLLGRWMMQKVVELADELQAQGKMMPIDGMYSHILQAKGWLAACPLDDTSLVEQVRSIPSYVLGDGDVYRSSLRVG
jgi:hypothetical protein